MCGAMNGGWLVPPRLDTQPSPSIHAQGLLFLSLLSLQCDDFCTSGGCDGYFVTPEGGCSRCPGNAELCDDLTGTIRVCGDGRGLIGGECRTCMDENCLNCDGKSACVHQPVGAASQSHSQLSCCHAGNLQQCSKCFVNKARVFEGYYVDPGTRTWCAASCCTLLGGAWCSFLLAPSRLTLWSLGPLQQAVRQGLPYLFGSRKLHGMHKDATGSRQAGLLTMHGAQLRPVASLTADWWAERFAGEICLQHLN